jgi:acyl-CoA synthetase (AMP-forming)/AMP-acid ligase II
MRPVMKPALPARQSVGGVAYPDPRLSEVGVAFVRLEAGAKLTEAEALDYCRGRIASFKIPRHVFVIEEFPWTGSGKIQKVKLREEVPPAPGWVIARRRPPMRSPYNAANHGA